MRRRWRGTSLAGVTAAFTTLPVIGVPILGKATDGLDSLLSMVQMPLGVPVAHRRHQRRTQCRIVAVQILADGSLRLHGWFFVIATAELFAFDPDTKQFLPLGIDKA